MEKRDSLKPFHTQNLNHPKDNKTPHKVLIKSQKRTTIGNQKVIRNKSNQ